MTQQYMGQIPDPSKESGTDLAARLNAFDNAHRTNQSGPTRPASILAGGFWTRVVAGVYDLMLFDGAQDRIVMRVDSNLAGLPNLELARTNLGLKALATKDKAAIASDTTGTLPLNRGGTGGTTQAAAREGLGFTLASGALSRLNESVNHIDSSWLAGVSDVPGLASPKQIAGAIGALVPPSVGVGQKWHKVGRNRGVAYQNTTGRVIQVYLRFHNLPMSFSTSEDGTAWDQLVGNIGSSAMTFILPPGHYYLVSGTGTIGESLELR